MEAVNISVGNGLRVVTVTTIAVSKAMYTDVFICLKLWGPDARLAGD